MLKIGPVLTIVACSAGASAGVANLTGMPDFSQHAVSSWQNHCAPTAAADLVYYYAQSFSNLGGPLPPDPIADTHANATIADLAFRMGTTSSGGTTPAGLVAGLDTHLEDTWDGVGGGANWNTVLHEGAVVGGGGLRAAIESAIIGGDGVILLIAWQGGLPADPNYDTPDGYQGENVGPNDPMGHAVALVGFDNTGPAPTFSINDPANNGGMHNWSGEGSVYTLTEGLTTLTLSGSMGGATATVYGAVTTSFIPTPATSVLVGFGGLCALRRRRC